MKKFFFVFTLLVFSPFVFGQEALKSLEEDYFDFLSLQGVIERPYLNYRTLSDSKWDLTGIEENEKNVWKKNNLGNTFTLFEPETKSENGFLKGVPQGIYIRPYGPEWFNSVNTDSPFGQNDGALWQGRGYNTSFTTGVRFEGYGLEFTFKPQLSFSQNAGFELLPSLYTNEFGYFWGYGNSIGIDNPQRFGNSPFWNFDWGDSEIRYSWHSLTIGFGTQSTWIGPAFLNPILHSNNSASYPKFDIGIRKQKIVIPYLNWSLGFIESHMWVGKLTESEYFDKNPENNNNLYSGFTFSYAPSFIPGLSLSINKICLAKWDSEPWKYLNPFYNDNDIYGPGEDQKMSISVDYLFPGSKLELYAELGIDDYLQGGGLELYLRYPWDSMCYLLGLKKEYDIYKDILKGELIFEFTSFEQPWNKITENQAYFFYGHHQITQGYTNKGQILGSPLGVGGNGQLLQFNLYYPKGVGKLIFYRTNPNDVYAYNILKNKNARYRAEFLIKGENQYFVTDNIIIGGGFGCNIIWHKTYSEDTTETNCNFIFNISLKLLF